MEDPDKLLIRKKLEKVINPPSRDVHYVDGSAVGATAAGLIHCMINGREGDKVNITLADGPDTGCKFSVPERMVQTFGDEFFEDASRGLF